MRKRLIYSRLCQEATWHGAWLDRAADERILALPACTNAMHERRKRAPGRLFSGLVLAEAVFPSEPRREPVLLSARPLKEFSQLRWPDRSTRKRALFTVCGPPKGVLACLARHCCLSRHAKQRWLSTLGHLRPGAIFAAAHRANDIRHPRYFLFGMQSASSLISDSLTICISAFIAALLALARTALLMSSICCSAYAAFWPAICGYSGRIVFFHLCHGRTNRSFLQITVPRPRLPRR